MFYNSFKSTKLSDSLFTTLFWFTAWAIKTEALHYAIIHTSTVVLLVLEKLLFTWHSLWIAYFPGRSLEYTSLHSSFCDGSNSNGRSKTSNCNSEASSGGSGSGSGIGQSVSPENYQRQQHELKDIIHNNNNGLSRLDGDSRSSIMIETVGHPFRSTSRMENLENEVEEKNSNETIGGSSSSSKDQNQENRNRHKRPVKWITHTSSLIALLCVRKYIDLADTDMFLNTTYPTVLYKRLLSFCPVLLTYLDID